MSKNPDAVSSQQEEDDIAKGGLINLKKWFRLFEVKNSLQQLFKEYADAYRLLDALLKSIQLNTGEKYICT